MNSQLLPCPFCGESPLLRGSLGRFFIVHVCESIQSNIGVGQRKDVIQKWNIRHVKPTCINCEEPEVSNNLCVCCGWLQKEGKYEVKS